MEESPDMTGTKTARPGIWLGTMGFSYSDWAGGVFYPPGMKAGDYLLIQFGRNDHDRVRRASRLHRPDRPVCECRRGMGRDHNDTGHRRRDLPGGPCSGLACC